ncbi:HD domain-containing protein [Microbacterium sp. A93]|uniref:HD domain-containing protein n=1 Tax=Microbacterium sp. A93 TaxID=3450716 RepID=UPI003F439332
MGPSPSAATVGPSRTPDEAVTGPPLGETRLMAYGWELVREASSDLIYDHSRRVYVFGALRGREQGLAYDPELLYVGAMFHDPGLTEKYRRDDQRFEVDGADEARRFLTSHGIAEQQADRVWQAIALHTTPEIPLHMVPEVALVTRGWNWTCSASAMTRSPRSSAGPWWPHTRARTSRSRSCRRSPRGSGTAPRRPSAT